MKIYIAGPIEGHDYNEVYEQFFQRAIALREMGWQVLSPWCAKYPDQNGILKGPVVQRHAIFERDMWMVSQADVVYADLTESGDRISIGTVMELAVASYLRKHTVTAFPVNGLYNHVFVREATDVEFYSADEAMEYLNTLVEGY